MAEQEQKVTKEDMAKKYGHVYEIRVEDLKDENEEFVSLSYTFKRPKTPEIDRFLKELSQKPSVAMRNYIFSTVVPEDADRLRQDIERFPGIVAVLANKLNDLTGLNANAELKKL